MAISFAVAAKRYFGVLPGQGVANFVGELKQLTKEDRDEMRPMLADELKEEIAE